MIVGRKEPRWQASFGYILYC